MRERNAEETTASMAAIDPGYLEGILATRGRQCRRVNILAF
jgi:hypothetical protein